MPKGDFTKFLLIIYKEIIW